MLFIYCFLFYKISNNHGVAGVAAAVVPTDFGLARPSPASSNPTTATDGDQPPSRLHPSDGDKSPPTRHLGARSGGLSRHRRGRRAGRLVQARRRLAIEAENERRLDFGRAVIPLLGPELAPGGEGAEAKGSSDRQPTAPGAWAMPCRVEHHPTPYASYRQGVGPTEPGWTAPVPYVPEPPPVPSRCLARPPRLTQRQTHRAGDLAVTADQGAECPADQRGNRPQNRGGRGDRRNEDNSILIYQINVQSLKPKILELRQHLADTGCDVILVCETWLSPHVPSRLVTFPGFDMVRSDRRTGRGGGVAVLARDNLGLTVLKKRGTTGSSNIETVWARVQIGRTRSALLCSVYRKPVNTCVQITADFDELESQIQYMMTIHTGLVVIAGDFNCDVRQFDSDTPAGRLLDLLGGYQLHPLITADSGATYRPSGSTLDLIFTNQPSAAEFSGVTPCPFSPHNFTHALIRVPRHRRPACTVQSRCWSRIDFDDLQMKLAEIDWRPVFASGHPGDQTEYLVRGVLAVLDDIAPVRTLKIRNPTAPPVTDETKRLMSERRAALANGERQRYKELNRLTRSAIRRDSRDDLRRRIREAGPNNMYRCLRPIIAGKKDGPNTTPETDPDVMNDYFVQIGTQTAASVTASRVGTTSPDLPSLLPRVCSDRFRVQPVSLEHLTEVVRSMSNSKSCGDDGLPLIVIKRCLPVLAPVILCIINTSLVTGIVPDSWKMSLVKPIYKSSGPLNDPANFRPISIVPGIAKIAERIVHEQLYYFFETRHLFADSQHGFRRHHSTQTALTSVSDTLLRAMDSGEIAMLVLLDLSKCFDVVNHEKLLQKLLLHGVDTHWFEDYLRNHRQKVSFNCKHRGQLTSQSRTNPIGVYQGSALGPLLYSIFSNDVSLHVERDVHITQYADDTQIVVSGRKANMGEVIRRVERAVSTMYQWFGQHAMKLNAGKTQLVVVGTQQMLRHLPPVSIRVGGTVIEESSAVRNLGVIFDRSLTFSAHIANMKARCNGLLVALAHVRHSLPSELINTVVEGLVISIVRYCISVYGSANQTNMKQVQSILNFCAKIMTNRRKFDHISDVVSQNPVLNVRQLAHYHNVTAMHNIITTGQPASLARSIAQNAETTGRNTRQANDIRLPPVRQNSGKRQLLYRAAADYNTLSPRVRALNRKRFAAAVKRDYLPVSRASAY